MTATSAPGGSLVILSLAVLLIILHSMLSSIHIFTHMSTSTATCYFTQNARKRLWAPERQKRGLRAYHIADANVAKRLNVRAATWL